MGAFDFFTKRKKRKRKVAHKSLGGLASSRTTSRPKPKKSRKSKTNFSFGNSKRGVSRTRRRRKSEGTALW